MKRISFAFVAAVLVCAALARAEQRAPGRWRLADVQPRPGGHTVLAAGADQCRERFATHPGVDRAGDPAARGAAAAVEARAAGRTGRLAGVARRSRWRGAGAGGAADRPRQGADRPRRRRRRWPGANPEATPIVVNGVMYLPSQGNRILALDAETGKELWRHELPKETPTTARGVAYWPGDRDNPARILFTAGPKLVALNATTGDLSSGFGQDGKAEIAVPWNGVPTVYKNVVVLGATTGRSRARAVRRHARVRCAHRREAVGVSHRAAARRERARDVAERRMEGTVRRQQLGLVPDRR